ncbi:MAG: methylmalonyl Co-A mutase-associated GTPase MeaB [Daejeonella sp.]
MISVPQLINQVKAGDFKDLARAITLVENGLEGSAELLRQLKPGGTPVIGITGPPGAGKSTLVNALINNWASAGKRVAVIAIDPTSPFNLGSLLGDRIRMAGHFNNRNVYIRSIATRGSLGGLSAKTIEITDVLQSAGFDYIIVETVGVGQSEVEIAGLADISVVVLVPESGDEIQNIKSGLMEIADIFVVNKSDREGAETFANNLKKLVHQKSVHLPVIKTVAHCAEGVGDLIHAIEAHSDIANHKKPFLLAEKAWKLIQIHRMKDIDKNKLQADLEKAYKNSDFNLYSFVEAFVKIKNS